jgi:hypothetical protein
MVCKKQKKSRKLFQPGQSGNPAGKRKGTLNKFTTLKRAFLDAFEQTGGAQGLMTWIEENKRNRAMFYQMITKLFPQEVEQSGSVNVGGKMIVEVVHVKDGPVKPGGGNGDGNK